MNQTAYRSMNMSHLTDNAASLTLRSKRYIGIRNTAQGYGLVAILLHWLVALSVIGLFSLGVWMTGLTYYDEWYKRGPDIHKSIGILLFLTMLVRVIWRTLNIKPDDDPGIGACATSHCPWRTLCCSTGCCLR